MEKVTYKIDLSDKLLQDLDKFRVTRKFTDVSIICGEDKTKFAMHRLLLCLKSEYFFNYFLKYENAESIPTEIFCKQLDSNVFKYLYDFFYNGQITLTPENTIPIMSHCYMLQIRDLKSVIAKYLMERINYFNAGTLLDAGLKFKEKELYDYAFNFILKYAEHVILTDDFAKNVSENEFIRLLGSLLYVGSHL